MQSDHVRWSTSSKIEGWCLRILLRAATWAASTSPATRTATSPDSIARTTEPRADAPYVTNTQGHSVRQPSIRMHPLITLASRSTHHRNSIYRFVNPETFQTITDNTVREFAVVLLIGPSQFVEVLMFTLNDVSCLEALDYAKPHYIVILIISNTN